MAEIYIILQLFFFFNFTSKLISCFSNPLLGDTIGRFFLTNFNASLYDLNIFLCIKYAITKLDERDMPALQ